VQLFDRYATYNGSDPYRAPATLNMIAHLEHNIGTYFPQGGIYQIADALYRLAMKKGVTFEFDSEVENITLRGKSVTGVRVKGEDRVFDRVVCDADVNYVASKLVKHPLEKRLKRAELSTSALIFYWGINRKYDILDVHNVIFSGDYASEFKLLFERKILSFDPTIYIFVSSKAVPADAPDGCENWFVMLNAPIDSGQNWSTFINQSRAVVIKKINATLGIDLEKHIVVEKIATPKTIEKNTNSLHGALYGSASNSAFSAFLRHPNRVSGLKNIFFVGGSVHPGGGIPLCLASAAIVDKEFK
jgi:phytoene desaturase